VSSYGCVFSLSAESGMKFLLGSDKGFVSFVIKRNVSEDSADNERSDNFDRWINGD
jgi:hypothetical protein